MSNTVILQNGGEATYLILKGGNLMGVVVALLAHRELILELCELLSVGVKLLGEFFANERHT